MTENGTTSTLRELNMSKILNEREFICSCCFELLIEPTSLHCGHSFCRHCIAQSYLITKQTSCLLCRATWDKTPQVNILLRNTIETLFSDKVEQRKQSLKEQGIDKILKEFNESMHKINSPKTKWLEKFFVGFIISNFVGIVFIFIWIRNSSSDDPLIQKPVDHWDIHDVNQWILELGPWAHTYLDKFIENKIDGRLLLSLTENDLSSSLFNITFDLHQRAFKKSLEDLREHGLKEPSDFWEYKERYRGKSLLLLYGMKNFPRLTMFFSYLCDYEATFLPFLKLVTASESSTSDEDNLVQKTSIGYKTWIDFLPKFILLPYLLVIQFALKFLKINYWISRFIICACVLSTYLEAIGFRWVVQVGPRAAIYYVVKQLLFLTLILVIFYLIWPLIPSLLIECFFYWFFYSWPIMQAEEILRRR